MQLLRATLMIPALLLGVSGCSSYDPPVRGDHMADQYKKDLETCRTSSTEKVRLRNAATPETWILSPYFGPGEVRDAIRTCMTSKGYVLEKTGS